MKIVYCKCANDVEEQGGYQLKKLAMAYSSSERITSLLDSSSISGFLRSPSPLSDRLGICVGSVVDKFNFLKFRDNDRYYYIIQNRFFCSALWIPDKEVIFFFAEAKIADDIIARLSSVESRLWSLQEPQPFVGLLNEKGRPYHYFYSKAPAIFSYKSNAKKLCLIDIEESTFIPGDFFCSVSGSVKRIKRYADLRGCSVFPGWPLGTGKSVIKEWQLTLNHALINERSDRVSGANKAPNVWIGLCSEKRENDGLEDVVVKFVEICAKRYPGVRIFLDGLTRPYHQTRGQFLKRRKDDSLLVGRIIDRLVFKSVDFQAVDLNGADFSEKVSASLQADFFFSFGLTDSMWCSVFGEVPGICWYGDDLRKLKSEHIHKYTYFLPKGNSYILKPDSTYSQEKFHFNSLNMPNVLAEGLDVALANSKQDFLSILSFMDLK